MTKEAPKGESGKERHGGRKVAWGQQSIIKYDERDLGPARHVSCADELKQAVELKQNMEMRSALGGWWKTHDSLYPEDSILRY